MPAPSRAPRARPVAAPARAAAPAAASRGATARATVPAVAPREATAARPRLRVVDEGRRRAQLARQRRARLVVALAIAVVVGSVFALAAAHATLVSGQGRIDRLDAALVEARAEYAEARLEVAQLGAPDRIVQEARDRLGMVPPGEVRYLSPSPQLAAEIGATGDVGTTASDDRIPWAAVKPYLGANP
ncbi:MAG: septum formation initiator family protein [Acidimicrobiia bacterium]